MEPIEFGRYLKSLREEMALTMRELDKRSGVSHSYISQLERGERAASPEILNKLAGPLGVKVTELLLKAGHIPANELEDNKSPSSVFDKYIRSFVHLLIGDNESPFSSERSTDLDKSVSQVCNKHGIKLKINVIGKNHLDIVNQYVESILNIDNVQFKFDILQELQDLAHKYHLWFNPIYEYKSSVPKAEELKEFIRSEHITYNGQPLNEDDRKRILIMLEQLFPDRES